MKINSLIACIIIFLLLNGCAETTKRNNTPNDISSLSADEPLKNPLSTIDYSPQQYMLSYDEYGNPIDPNGCIAGWCSITGAMTRVEYTLYVDTIINSIKKSAEEKKVDRVVIFIHGGLNDLNDCLLYTSPSPRDS